MYVVHWNILMVKTRDLQQKNKNKKYTQIKVAKTLINHDIIF